MLERSMTSFAVSFCYQKLLRCWKFHLIFRMWRCHKLFSDKVMTSTSKQWWRPQAAKLKTR